MLTSTHEGSPTVVKEALACGLPVVSTDVGDVLEVFGRLDCCSVAPDDSATTLAKCLIDMLSRPCGRTPEATMGRVRRDRGPTADSALRRHDPTGWREKAWESACKAMK